MGSPEVDVFGKGLVKPVIDANLPEKSLLSRDEARLEFVERMSEGRLHPFGVDLSESSAIMEMDELAERAVVVPDSPLTNVEQLQKLFERFVPQAGVEGSEEYTTRFVHFLDERGIGVVEREYPSLRKSLVKSLKRHGKVVYFPRGVTREGKAVLEEHFYLPEDLERELLAASAWDLVPKGSREVYRNSHQVSVGLSVGSEMLFAALCKGITNFTLTDPGTLHADLKGRLGLGFDEHFLGINKTMFMVQQVIRLFPYALIRVFPEGLSKRNMHGIINKDLLSSEQLAKGGKLLVAEEADGWGGKEAARRAVRDLPTDVDWHINMAGDVGHRVVYQHEQWGDEPFHGFVSKIDPRGDDYGVNLPEGSELAAILASVGGFTGIPGILLNMLAQQQIGSGSEARISRVPQEREATLLSAALYSEALRLIAEGGQVKKYAVADLGAVIDRGWLEKSSQREAEESLQEIMNEQFFKTRSLVSDVV